MKDLSSTKSNDKKEEKINNNNSMKDEFDEQFGNYKCRYCSYVPAQKWILERHIAAVHFKVCILQELCNCRKCSLPNQPKDPYRCKRFKSWH